jgi:acyl-CoA synthetase (NDP forming)
MTAAFTAMLDGPLDLAMLVLDWPRPDRCTAPGWDIAVAAISEAARVTGTRTAIVASMPENMPEEMAQALVAQGIAPLFGMEEAIAAAEAAFHAGKAVDPVPLLLSGPLHGDTVMLDEAQAKAALAAHGLAAPNAVTAVDTEALVEAARHLRYPLALKGLGIAHKSEAGAVVLDIDTPQALATAAKNMVAPQGFMAEEMVGEAICELIIGVTRDAAHGFVLTLGAGGVMAELISDSTSLLLPASRDEIRVALASLKIHAILTGWRGKPAGDIEAVIDAVEAVARYTEAQQARLAELDVNPLIVRASGAVAADALITLARENADVR